MEDDGLPVGCGIGEHLDVVLLQGAGVTRPDEDAHPIVLGSLVDHGVGDGVRQLLGFDPVLQGAPQYSDHD